MKYTYTHTSDDGAGTSEFLEQGDTTYVERPINTTEQLQRLIHKSNWRIVELPSGYFQAEFQGGATWHPMTRRETMDLCEEAIDASIAHYQTRAAYSSAMEAVRTSGPNVVRSFE